MPGLKETQARHAQDLINGNMAGLMGDFAPSGMAKAMALATSPLVAQSFEVKELGDNEAEISYIGATTRTIWSKWEETSPGKWQIADLAER